MTDIRITQTKQTLIDDQGRHIEKELSFDECVNYFLSQHDVKPISKKTYATALNNFRLFISPDKNKRITEFDIIRYKDELISTSKSIYTVLTNLSTLKSLYRFLSNRSLYPNITLNIRMPKKPHNFSRNALSKEQSRKLLAVVTNSKDNDLIRRRDVAIISTLLRCGLRAIEIVRANINDIRLSSGTPVLWVHGKGRDAKDEFVVLTVQAHQAIKNYLNIRGCVDEAAPLFISHGNRNKDGRITTRSISRMVKYYLRDIGLNEREFTCHSLRHTFATIAIENNAPLLQVQRSMRHSNINTTTIYTHMAERIKEGAEQYIDI